MRGIVQCKATTTSYSAKCTAMQQPQNAFSICSICSHSQCNAIQCCLQIEFLHCETCCFKKFSDNKFEKTALQSPCSHPLTFSFLKSKNIFLFCLVMLNVTIQSLLGVCQRNCRNCSFIHIYFFYLEYMSLMSTMNALRDHSSSSSRTCPMVTLVSFVFLMLAGSCI